MKSISAIIAMFTTAASLGARAESPADQQELVAANTGFAFDLMRQVAQAEPGKNIFISPFSVSCALQMVENGAAGRTREEMRRMLKTASLSADFLNPAFRDLNRELTSRAEVTLNLANGLWVQKGFELKPAFVELNRQYFLAGLDQVDFTRPQAANTINDWAGRHTHDKIKEVVQYPFPPLTQLILANAIYFKGQWMEPFKKALTGNRGFHLANGQIKGSPMMTQNGQFSYQETPKFQAVKLPYKGGLQMELYLPKTQADPQSLLGALSARDTVEQGFGRHEGTVVLPKFKLDYDIRLNDPLQALGMKSAFSRKADLSGIADGPLSISEVRQKSFVDVNEAGTEAAAVTVVAVVGSIARQPPPDRFNMILDHPFFFVISDASTGSVLFMGIVNDPAGD